jgi:hypothetical protein
MADFSDQSGAASGMAPAPYRPIRASDVARIKKNYGITRKFTKAESDTDIYNFSTKSIIDWWRRTKAEEAAAAAGDGVGASGGGASGGGPGGGGDGSSAPGAGKTLGAGGGKAMGPTPPAKPAKPKVVQPPTYAKQRESGVSKPVSSQAFVRRTNLNTGVRPY